MKDGSKNCHLWYRGGSASGPVTIVLGADEGSAIDYLANSGSACKHHAGAERGE